MSGTADLSAEDILAAAALLLEARRTRRRLEGLPERLRPSTLAAAHAIQDAVQAALGEPVGALKVNATPGGVYRGCVGASRVLASPARIPAGDAGMMGIEVEIGFLFEDGVPPRPEGYGTADLAARTAAFAAFDVVDTRLDAFMSRTQLERVADALNAGHIVHGPARRDWGGLDRATPQARLTVGGRTVFDGPGKHPAGDAFLPVLAYLDTVRAVGCPPGTRIVTGSFTGLAVAEPGDRVRADLQGFAPIELEFVRDTPTAGVSAPALPS